MHERIIGLYEENADAWDAQRGRDLFERPWLDRFTALLPPRGTVLDIGCGMGEPITRYLIERGFRVTGVDSSPSLLELARKRFPDHEWLAADMRALELGRAFDGILAWHSFFHLPPEHQRPMFARFSAHSREGTVLMFTSGGTHGESIGEWRGEPLYHGSLDPSEYRTLLARSGFSVLEHRLRDPDCGDATIWLARKEV
jgi:cyclopropane fatty-acyl-phospholipid synthase-like methyltransferase